MITSKIHKRRKSEFLSHNHFLTCTAEPRLHHILGKRYTGSIAKKCRRQNENKKKKPMKNSENSIEFTKTPFARLLIDENDETSQFIKAQQNKISDISLKPTPNKRENS